MKLSPLIRKTAVFAAVAAVFLLLQHATHTVCLLYAIIGLPCPACGTTRAALSLLHGDLVSAFHLHPLLPLLPVPAILWLRVHWLSSKPPRWWNRFLFAVLALYAVVYILRILLLFPHTEPMTWNQHALLPRLYRFLRSSFTQF